MEPPKARIHTGSTRIQVLHGPLTMLLRLCHLIAHFTFQGQSTSLSPPRDSLLLQRCLLDNEVNEEQQYLDFRDFEKGKEHVAGLL